MAPPASRQDTDSGVEGGERAHTAQIAEGMHWGSGTFATASPGRGGNASG